MNRRAAIAPSQSGFTLIELLIVIAIILLLAGMMMPMLTIIQKWTLRSRTGFILKKVDTSLRLMHDEYGVYPYQPQYPSVIVAATYNNNLNYRLGTNIAAADLTNIQTDLQAAGSAYAYGINPSAWAELPLAQQPPPGVVYMSAYMTNPGWGVQSAVIANRMASEQNRLAVLAGNTSMHGAYIVNPTSSSTLTNLSMVVDMRSTNVLTSPASAGNPGMAVNYLQGEIDPRYISGNNVLDAWYTPLIYISQAIPGERATWVSFPAYEMNGSMDEHDFGLGPLGFDTNSSFANDLIAAGRPLLVDSGRVALSGTDAGDGQATPADVTYFPTASNLMHSDVRYYAAPGFETEFELWSAGPDRNFNYMRDDPANLDNISVVSYNKRLTYE